MDILIKGIEMPKQCGQKYCPFSIREESYNGKPTRVANGETLYDRTTKDVEHWCVCLNKKNEQAILEHRRLDGCPLVALPEHGDLIQRDNLFEFIEKNEEVTVGEIYDFIQDAPVIVEATE